MVKNCFYWSKMVQYGSKITQNMKMAKIVQINLGQIIWYSNTFEYFHSQKYSLHFFMGKFIRIFICDIFIMTNIFVYSFGQYLWYQIYSEIHSSKNLILVPHCLTQLQKLFSCLNSDLFSSSFSQRANSTFTLVSSLCS